MGSLFSQPIIDYPQEDTHKMSFKDKLKLALTYSSSHILDDTSDTLTITVDYIDDQLDGFMIIKNKLYDVSNSDLVNIYKDKIFRIISSEEFKEMNPHAFRRIIFHTQKCTKIVIIDIPSNRRDDKEDEVDMCINMTGFDKY